MSQSQKRISVRPTATTIQVFNDGVLRATFEHWDDADLVSVADVCSTFVPIAQTEFASRFKSKRLRIVVANDGDRNIKMCLYHRCVPSVFRNFGSYIKSLEIYIQPGSMPKSSYEVMKLVTQFCATSLDELFLKKVMLTSIVVPELRQLLFRLQNLQLWFCSWKSDLLAELFSQRFELRTLSIEFNSGKVLILQAIQVKLSKLRSFIVSGVDGFTDRV